MEKQTQENEMGVDSKSMRELSYDELLDMLTTVSPTFAIRAKKWLF